jgi:hypothetical protein
LNDTVFNKINRKINKICKNKIEKTDIAVKIIVLISDDKTNDGMNRIPFELSKVVGVIPMKARDNKFPQANNTVLQSSNTFSTKSKQFSIIIIIILYFLCAESTATRPITDSTV